MHLTATTQLNRGPKQYLDMITRECKPIQELWKNAEVEKSIVTTKKQWLQSGVNQHIPCGSGRSIHSKTYWMCCDATWDLELIFQYAFHVFQVKDLEPENMALKVLVNKIATAAIHEMSMDSNYENGKGEQSSKLQRSVEEILFVYEEVTLHQIIAVLFISSVLCMMLGTINREAGYSCSPFVIALFNVGCADSLTSIGNLGSLVHRRVEGDSLVCICKLVLIMRVPHLSRWYINV